MSLFELNSVTDRVVVVCSSKHSQLAIIERSTLQWSAKWGRRGARRRAAGAPGCRSRAGRWAGGPGCKSRAGRWAGTPGAGTAAPPRRSSWNRSGQVADGFLYFSLKNDYYYGWSFAVRRLYNDTRNGHKESNYNSLYKSYQLLLQMTIEPITVSVVRNELYVSILTVYIRIVPNEKYQDIYFFRRCRKGRNKSETRKITSPRKKRKTLSKMYIESSRRRGIWILVLSEEEYVQ